MEGRRRRKEGGGIATRKADNHQRTTYIDFIREDRGSREAIIINHPPTSLPCR